MYVVVGWVVEDCCGDFIGYDFEVCLFVVGWKGGVSVWGFFDLSDFDDGFVVYVYFGVGVVDGFVVVVFGFEYVVVGVVWVVGYGERVDVFGVLVFYCCLEVFGIWWVEVVEGDWRCFWVVEDDVVM